MKDRPIVGRVVRRLRPCASLDALTRFMRKAVVMPIALTLAACSLPSESSGTETDGAPTLKLYTFDCGYIEFSDLYRFPAEGSLMASRPIWR